MQSESLYLFRHIIWYKPNFSKRFKGANHNGYSLPRKLPPHFNIEHILIFYKNFSDTVSTTDVKTRSEEILDRIDNQLCNDFKSSIWYIPTLNSSKKVNDYSNHPAPFPEDVPFRLIKLFTFKNEIVLDPFMGKGTSMKIALLTGRNAIGYELNPNYIDIFSNEYIHSDIKSLDYRNVYEKEYHKNSLSHSVDFDTYFKNKHAQDIISLSYTPIKIMN